MGSIDDFFDATGPGPTGFLTVFDAVNDPPPCAFGGVVYGSTAGLLGFSGNDGPNQKNGYSLRAGVMGASNGFTGVAGTSLNHPGVYGQVEETTVVPDGLLAGVIGTAETQPGVIGWSRSGDGLQGATFAGTALRAASFFGPGVSSISGALTGVTGISGTQGPQVPDIATIAGVVGTSSAQPGVIGTSNAAIGVLGFSNSVGVVGRTTNPNSFAGFFAGNVIVNGTLTANVKNGVVAFPDGTQRVLHCMESPEHWFEDFGTAKLARGRAVVRLDANFAKVVAPGDYRVFVTPEGDCRGLYVRSKSAARFEVRELQGGKSSVAFSYRIVARRKGIKRHRRFAKIDTRLPVRAPTPRKAAPTTAALRAFVASLEKEARQRRPKGAKKAGRSRALAKDMSLVWSPPHARRGALSGPTPILPIRR